MPIAVDAALAEPLPSVTATELVAGIQKVGRTVAAHGAVVITKHDQPTYVLMSVERYRELQRAAEPDLGHLGQAFDAMLDRMQTQGDAMADAFALAPEALGAVALKSAKGVKAAKAVKAAEVAKAPRMRKVA